MIWYWLNTIVGKGVENSTDKKFTPRNSTKVGTQNLPWNSMKYHFKACLTPLKLTGQGVYLSTLCQYLQQNAKQNRNFVSTGRQISTASLKKCTDVSAPSVRFSNFAKHSFLSSQLSKAKSLKVLPTKKETNPWPTRYPHSHLGQHLNSNATTHKNIRPKGPKDRGLQTEMRSVANVATGGPVDILPAA